MPSGSVMLSFCVRIAFPCHASPGVGGAIPAVPAGMSPNAEPCQASPKRGIVTSAPGVTPDRAACSACFMCKEFAKSSASK